MKNNSKTLLLISALALSAIMCTSTNSTDPQAPPLSADLNEVSGTVQMLKQETGILEDAADGTLIESGDQVVTHADSRVRVDISDGTIVRVGPLSSFTLKEMVDQDGHLDGRFKLDIGSIWIILHGGEVKVDTPSGLASVRGSYLFIYVNPGNKNTFVTCLEGECELGNDIGKVKMIAGQTATVINSKAIPQLGRMSAEDVADWLKNNPEATEVIVPLTKTVEARGNNGNGNGNGNDGDGNNGNGNGNGGSTIATATKTNTPLPPTITKTPTAINCGPATDWILHTVAKNEDIFTLAKAFQVDVEDIQKANCMGESTATVLGMTLYMPDVATITPTPTFTYTPTKTPEGGNATYTNTPIPATKTSTPKPTSTATSTPTATVRVTNSPMSFEFITKPAPKGGSILTCFNNYEVNITDADGVSSAKLIYSVGGTKASIAFLDKGNGNFKIFNHHIGTFGTGTDTVSWWIRAVDGNKVVKTSQIFTFTDPWDCGAPTSFSAESHPTDDYTIPNLASCSQTYSVDATDPDNLKQVYIQYSFALDFSSPQYHSLIQSGDTWSDTFEIDTTAQAGSVVPIYWRYKAVDNIGDHTYYPLSGYVLNDSISCDGLP